MIKNYFLLIFSFLTITFFNAQSGNALDFDGTDDYVTFDVPAIFQDVASQDFTIEAWIKPTGLETRRVFSFQTTSSNHIYILINGQRLLYVYTNDLTTNPNTSSKKTSTPLAFNTWSHIAITKSAANNELLIYINGVAMPTSSGGSTSFGTDDMMVLGARTDGANPFKGVIDEFRIWSSVRTAAEINANMHNELTLPQPNLVAYYKFNQGVANGNNAGVTALDDELATLGGTLLNFTLDGTTSNWVGTALATKETSSKTQFSVVPNPAENEIKVSGLEQKSQYSIFNAIGQLIKTGSIERGNNTIELSELKRGVYFINVGDKKAKFIKK